MVQKDAKRACDNDNVREDQMIVGRISKHEVLSEVFTQLSDDTTWGPWQVTSPAHFSDYATGWWSSRWKDSSFKRQQSAQTVAIPFPLQVWRGR